MAEGKSAGRALTATVVGPGWHGPSVLDTLKDITAEQANARPIAGAHTIWELVLHITAWEEYGAEAFEGRAPGKEPAKGDWPPVSETTPEAWARDVAALKAAGERAAAFLTGLDDDAIRKTVPGRDYPIKVLAHGVAHHNCYHAGQIALLKKLV